MVFVIFQGIYLNSKKFAMNEQELKESTKSR